MSYKFNVNEIRRHWPEYYNIEILILNLQFTGFHTQININFFILIKLETGSGMNFLKYQENILLIKRICFVY